MNTTQSGQFPRLSFWCAQPLGRDQARDLLATAERRRQAYLRRGRSCVTCELQAQVARFWLGEQTADHFAVLRARLRNAGARARALVDLTEGQLLISRRMDGAFSRLKRGFALAEPLLSPADYFALLRRHHQLAVLPLSPAPLPPEGLEGLLATAAVMERMGGGRERRVESDPNDLYG